MPFVLRDERVANRLDDLASRLDAGLVPAELRPGSAGIVADLGNSLELSDREHAILEAAEQAGLLPRMLRQQAAARRARAAAWRDIVARLRYPALLLAMACFTFVVSGLASGRPPSVSLAEIAGVGIVLGALLIAALRLARRPSFAGGGVPGLAPLLRDLGELPYLEMLGGLYGAGVKLKEAHEKAVRAVPIGSVRLRLARSSLLLQDGESLAAALASTAALTAESLQLVRDGEQSGGLEDALQRACARRRAVLQQRLSSAARWFATTVTVLVYAFVIYIIFDFYTGYYGRLLGSGR